MSKSLCPVIILAAMSQAGCLDEANRADSVLRLAVTTSTRDSGLLDILVSEFEDDHQVRVDVIAVGTGAALKLGEAGDVDAALVHSRADEDAFMEAGHGLRREDVMYNTFVILGPEGDPAGIRDGQPAESLHKIADTGQPFVSRGDGSGTTQREYQLWNDGGGWPAWDGYIETGQGMGATLTIADQMNAYVLSDRGTYLKFKNRIELVPLITSGDDLHNPYGIIVVNPGDHSGGNRELADAFTDFIISPEAQRMIGDYRIDGELLFHPHRIPDAR